MQTVTETVPATTVFVSAGAPDTSGTSDKSSPTTFVSDSPPSVSDDSDIPSFVSSATLDPSLTWSDVVPFTTLTIDIWDTGSGRGSGSAQTSSDVAVTSTTAGSAESSGKTPTDDPGRTDEAGEGDASDSGSEPTNDVNDDASRPTAYETAEDSQGPTDGGPPAMTQSGAEITNEASTWYTVVTDSDVYWTTGPIGPSQVTILLSHTLTLNRPAATASDVFGTDQIGPQSKTVVGSDGNPTIIVEPSNIPDTGDGQASQHYSACTKTITGTDGKPTIIIEPLSEDSGSGSAVPSGLSSLTSAGWPGISSSPEYPSGLNQPPHSGTAPVGGIYTTFTSFGADGLPTVIESALPFPRPAPVTQSGPLPTQPPPVGQPSLSGPGSVSTLPLYAPQDGLGITTSFTFTYLGANGPTAVESTVVIIPTIGVSGSSNALPTFFSNTAGVTNGIPQPAPAVTTCFSYTVTGGDGLPTVVDSTVVLAPTNMGSDGKPVPTIPAIPGASQGLPVPGAAPVTTAFSHTFVGADGHPTVLETTLVVTPSAGFSAPTLTLGSLNGFPTGIPPISGADEGGSAAPVTTCTAFTYVGPDGNPTVTEYTYTIPGSIPVATVLPENITPPLSLPGSPTLGVSGLPDNAAFTSSTTFTYIGPDGKPTATEYMWTTTGPLTAATALPEKISPPIGFQNPLTLGTPGIPHNTAVTTCTTLTYIGADGKPTVTDYTWTAAAPITVATALPGNGTPGFSVPALPTPRVSGGQDGAVTTCATYTMIGVDGQPTITEASWIIPGPYATQTPLPLPHIPSDVSNGLPSGISGQITGLPGSPPNPGLGNGGVATTICASYTILGADGKPTVIQTSWTVPIVGGIPTPTSLGFPSVVPTITNLPPGISTWSAVTTSYTALSVGPDGIFTPVVQTIVYTPDSFSATAGEPLSSGAIGQSSATGVPALSQYGQGSANTEAGFPASPPGFTPIITDGRQLPVSGVLPSLITGTVTATSTSTKTETSFPWPGFPGAPEALPPSYGGADHGGSDGSELGGLAQPYSGGSGGLPSELTLWPSSAVYGVSVGNPPAASTSCSITTLRTSTWVNVIPEQTTTYTMNYPLTTLVTVPTPTPISRVKRAVRRQHM